MISPWIAVAGTLAGVFAGGGLNMLNEWLKWRREDSVRNDRFRVETYAVVLARGFELLVGGTSEHLRADEPNEGSADQRALHREIIGKIDRIQAQLAMDNALQVVEMVSTKPVIQASHDFGRAIEEPRRAKERGESIEKIEALVIEATIVMARLHGAIREERGTK